MENPSSMIIEYFKSTIESIRERTKNPFSVDNKTPFAGAFILAFVFYNWKLFFSLVSFDDSDKRLSKIDIISTYLANEAITERIGVPILIAFLTIVLYYFFNLLSLGITTFFNRWFKSLILHFTDRSKIISRDEYDKVAKKLEFSRTQFEDLKKTFSESQTELENFKNAIISTNEDNRGLKLDNDRLRTELASEQNELSHIENQKNNFKILTARYGRYKEKQNVTEIIEEFYKYNITLDVENERLGGDPVPGAFKELEIVYQVMGETYYIVAFEHDLLIKENQHLIVQETKKAKAKAASFNL